MFSSPWQCVKFFNYRSFPDPKTIGYITPEMARNGNSIIDHRDESLNVFILNDKDEEEKTKSLQLFVETRRKAWLRPAFCSLLSLCVSVCGYGSLSVRQVLVQGVAGSCIVYNV